MNYDVTRAARRLAAAAMCAMLLPFGTIAHAQDDETPEPPGWNSIRKEFYDGREIAESKLVVVEAPDKAEDASVVPVTIYLNAEVAENIKSLRVFIDNNPMPLVGSFSFGRAAGVGSKTISTRVRFDSFSYIRAIAETEDGRLFMDTHFVQAAGGCSSPAIKDATEAAANAGQMNIKKIAAQRFASSRNQSMVTAEGQVMLKHPNYSGMQMDPGTGQYIPAKYVRSIDVSRGGELIFHMEAGISLSTNPNVRFTYGSVEGETLEAKAEDSDGATFNAVSAGDS